MYVEVRTAECGSRIYIYIMYDCYLYILCVIYSRAECCE